MVAFDGLVANQKALEVPAHRFRPHLDGPHSRQGGAIVTPFHERIHLLRQAFERPFDTTIREIPNPTANTQPLSFSLRLQTKTNALNSAANRNVNPFHQ